MKRNLILAVVVVAALSLAGAGGVFATWSDSEISFNNTIMTGNLDLKVNGADDAPWGEGIPQKVYIDHMVPCKYYGPFEVELWHAGQCQFPAHAYLELKNFVCSNIEPKYNPFPNGGSMYWPAGECTGYPAPADDPNAGQFKSEPELVAEWGGKVDCVTVPGIGPEGDECSLGTHIEMIVTLAPLPPNDPYYTEYPEELIRRDKLGKWIGEIYLFDLMPCQPKFIFLWFHMQQDTEEMYGYNFIPNPTDDDFPDPVTEPEEYAAALLRYQKFNDWPSWALMKDQVLLDLQFDLWLEDSPGGWVMPDGTVKPPPGA
jgi:predicted ribosomally synthesized peptide with SipW-like signal peptide